SITRRRPEPIGAVVRHLDQPGAVVGQLDDVDGYDVQPLDGDEQTGDISRHVSRHSTGAGNEAGRAATSTPTMCHRGGAAAASAAVSSPPPAPRSTTVKSSGHPSASSTRRASVAIASAHNGEAVAAVRKCCPGAPLER